MQRVKTGVHGLDQLLFGGFLQGDAVLVAGSPGTGKTSLGMQYLYNGIMDYDEPGFFITFEEFPQQIYRDALNFGWDFRRLEEENRLKVLFTSPDLMQQDIQRQEGWLPEMMREINAKRLVVDSITHFRRLADNLDQYREMIYGIINAIKREGMTSILIQEVTQQEALGAGSEDYVADSVIRLSTEMVEGQRMRYLEVIKSRGSRHIPIRSLFTIRDSGIQIVPGYQEPFFRYEEAASTGIPELDALLGGGIPYGSFYLLEVDSAINRQAFELNFVKETLQSGDIYVELAESAHRSQDLSQMASTLGMSDQLEEGIRSGAIQILGGSGWALSDSDTVAAGVSARKLLPAFDQIYRQAADEQKVRVRADLSGLLSALPADEFFPVFGRLLEMTRQFRGVMLGLLNPLAVSKQTRERIRTAADGNLRIWQEGGYHRLQVVKSVNSVRTPVVAFLETPQPPFIEILPY